MDFAKDTESPHLVSVIIPCYNHAHFLAEAIESVLAQSYPAVEILVVDDGSTDHTREVAARYPRVRYLHQHNQGLSASRNTGIRHSQGRYLVFLDADDLLYPWALERNVALLQQHPEAAFVSGAHDKVYVEEHTIKADKREVLKDHYCKLLQGNYIGMPAAVMYQHWVFREFLFDETPPNCSSDYDLTLRIARKYPVLHHTDLLAAYRLHSSNMSSNIPMMLSATLRVLKQQEPYLTTEAERIAFRKGLRSWKEYYCRELFRKLRAKNIKASRSTVYTLLKYKPEFLLRYLAMNHLRLDHLKMLLAGRTHL